MKGRKTGSSLAVCFLMVTGCGASAQGVASSANASRFYDARLLKPGAAVASEEPGHALELRLVTRFALAPASVQGLVRISPHPDNRLLRVVIDGEDYYRSSDTQLDGDGAAQHHFFTWRSLPPGSYTIVAFVYGPHGVRGQRLGSLEVVGERTAQR